nr:MAG: integrase-like protein [Sesarmops intermedium nimavirus]
MSEGGGGGGNRGIYTGCLVKQQQLEYFSFGGQWCAAAAAAAAAAAYGFLCGVAYVIMGTNSFELLTKKNDENILAQDKACPWIAQCQGSVEKANGDEKTDDEDQGLMKSSNSSSSSSSSNHVTNRFFSYIFAFELLYFINVVYTLFSQRDNEDEYRLQLNYEKLVPLKRKRRSKRNRKRKQKTASSSYTTKKGQSGYIYIYGVFDKAAAVGILTLIGNSTLLIKHTGQNDLLIWKHLPVNAILTSLRPDSGVSDTAAVAATVSGCVVMERREAQRKKFCDVISSSGRLFFTSRKLKNYIKRVITAKEVDRQKSPGEYALLKKYDVARIGGGKTILIKKDSIDPYVRYIPDSEIFDVIYDAHVNVCHGGQKRTYREVKKTVGNVTQEQVAQFVSYCVICEEKRLIRKNKRVLRPITSGSYSERGQVDLIDMRSCKTADGYCYILHYQDHFTKFSILVALHSKQTTEVSKHLYEIFTLMGAPKILQCDNGKEFIGAPLKTMMKRFWPRTKLVHGSPRHPQSQGSVEKANGDIKRMLSGLMREKKTCWVDLLKQVQWTKNMVNHRVIGMSPYEAVFGQKHVSPMKISEQEETDDEDQEGIEQQQQQQPCNEQMEIDYYNQDGVQPQQQQQQQQQQSREEEVTKERDDENEYRLQPSDEEASVPEEGEVPQERENEFRLQLSDEEASAPEEEGEVPQGRDDDDEDEFRLQLSDEKASAPEEEEEEEVPKERNDDADDEDEFRLQLSDEEVSNPDEEQKKETEDEQQLYDDEISIPEREEAEEENDDALTTRSKQRLEHFIKIRQRVREGIERQATAMIQTTSSSLHPEVNDCVNITVPHLDRPQKTSMQNIVGIIVGIEEYKGHKLYNVATQHGCIRPLLSRNQFEICRRKNVIDVETVDRERILCIRKIAAAEAKRGSEEPSSSFCRCATDSCRTMRCLCRRSGVSCTERCQHGRNPQTGRINHEIAISFRCSNS